MGLERLVALGWLASGLGFGLVKAPWGRVARAQSSFVFAEKGFAEKGTGKGLSGPLEPSATQQAQTLQLQADGSERFAMVYTCGQCENRNVAAVSKVAYQEGLVIVTCQHCGAKHLVADNQGLMDVKDFGKNIEEYLASKGEEGKIRTSLPEGVAVAVKEDGTVEVTTQAASTEAASTEAAKSANTEPEAAAAAAPETSDAPPAWAITTTPTKPIDGQKPGTSGLRKKTKVWETPFYTENFVQSILSAWETGKVSSLVLGGDGRYFSDTAISTILKICAANGVRDVHVGQHGILSTPAVSGLIRSLGADGGIVLTASHNPGGPDEDFGIKFNNKRGAPAPEAATDLVYEATTTISEIKTLEGAPDVDLTKLGTTMLGDMAVHVVDSVEGYVAILEDQFDFPKLRAFAERHPDFRLVFDAMHGAAGPYADRIFRDKLGLPGAECLRCNPLPDFGGGHPDPNLVIADDIVNRMGLRTDGTLDPGAKASEVPDLGAASDGDGDRNMILGKQCFVTPSDSLAVIADWANEAIPGIARRGGLKSVARSMPTSGAADVVAAKKGLRCFATPTGWKFFGNLMDSSSMGGDELTPLLCGEESFGTGSDHVREKDGVWAVLAWLSILATANDPETSPFADQVACGQLVGVKDILERHWGIYGRHLYSRWDFEGLAADPCNEMVDRLRGLDASKIGGEGEAQAPAVAASEVDAFGELLGAVYGSDALGDGGEASAPGAAGKPAGLKLVDIEDFSYVDPVDGSISKKQGLVMSFDGALSAELSGRSRAVVRLSGTGSSGATVRLYLEHFDSSGFSNSVEKSAPQLLEPLAKAAMDLMEMAIFTGTDKPTVIT